MNLMRKFLEDNSGLETVEWAVIIGVIVLAALSAFTPLSRWMRARILGVMR